MYELRFTLTIVQNRSVYASDVVEESTKLFCRVRHVYFLANHLAGLKPGAAGTAPAKPPPFQQRGAEPDTPPAPRGERARGQPAARLAPGPRTASPVTIYSKPGAPAKRDAFREAGGGLTRPSPHRPAAGCPAGRRPAPRNLRALWKSQTRLPGGGLSVTGRQRAPASLGTFSAAKLTPEPEGRFVN